MANTETHTAQGESELAAPVADDFSVLLQQAFKPKTERTREAVTNAVQTLAEQVLQETSLVSDDAVETIEGMADIADKLELDGSLAKPE